MKLSLVIPVFNEEESLEALYWELDEVAQAQRYELEAIFVDDGSSDGSWRAISSLAARDPRVRGIRFRRNFGKAAALAAGFQAAQGDVVFTLDADLQDDPHEIPRFLQKLDDGLDLVSGWKQVRRDPWHKVLPSRMFNWLVSRLTGVRLHDHNCGMKCYRREVVREVRLYGERHRFVPVLAHARGFRVGEIAINHRPRKYGKSKYGMKRLVKGFLDLLTVKFLTGYGQRPQHLLGTLGLVCFLFGAISLTVLAALWVLSRTWTSAFEQPIHLHERAVFFYSLGALLLGGQFMTVGFLAELIAEQGHSEEQTYSVAERTPETDDKKRNADNR
jgi:dolichol-phosphate mannosyltransferase